MKAKVYEDIKFLKLYKSDLNYYVITFIFMLFFMHFSLCETIKTCF